MADRRKEDERIERIAEDLAGMKILIEGNMCWRPYFIFQRGLIINSFSREVTEND